MKSTKLGHEAPKGWRINKFNYIELIDNFAHCVSHNFVYNTKVEKEKLYNGQPCYYTDARFTDSNFNNYGNCYLHSTRFQSISLKACIRKTLKCKNIPLGTILRFTKSYYYPDKKFNGSFNFKIRKENKLDIKYEISEPSYAENFVNCEFSKQLTTELRKNGFIVSVNSDNDNFISSLVSMAILYSSGEYKKPEKEIGEIAIAYGHGKKIGFSSKDNTLLGYSYGCENVLWDTFEEFDKWSRCNQIPKTSSVEEILNILMTPNLESAEA